MNEIYIHKGSRRLQKVIKIIDYQGKYCVKGNLLMQQKRHLKNF